MRKEKKERKAKVGNKTKEKQNVERKKGKGDAEGCSPNFSERESSFLSRFVGDPTVGFLRDKKGSCSTQRGQRVDSDFWEFLQNPRGRIFSYSVYF